jgi:hypothetical protein
MNTLTTPEVVGRCRAGHFVPATWGDVQGGWITCPCGRPAVAKAFTAKTSTKMCGARCTSSLGPSCSCECGGRNHGADHHATTERNQP